MSMLGDQGHLGRWLWVLRVYSPGVQCMISYTPGDQPDVTHCYCHHPRDTASWHGLVTGGPCSLVCPEPGRDGNTCRPHPQLPAWLESGQYSLQLGPQPDGKYTAWHSPRRWFRAVFPSGTFSLTDSEEKLLGDLSKCKQWFMTDSESTKKWQCSPILFNE